MALRSPQNSSGANGIALGSGERRRRQARGHVLPARDKRPSSIVALDGQTWVNLTVESPAVSGVCHGGC